MIEFSSLRRTLKTPLWNSDRITRLDSAWKVDLEPIFNCSNLTYHHEVVIILVRCIIAVVEIIQHKTTEFPTHNWRPILTRIGTVVPLQALEVLKKEYFELDKNRRSYWCFSCWDIGPQWTFLPVSIDPGYILQLAFDQWFRTKGRDVMSTVLGY
jgi:hypothetical protein